MGPTPVKESRTETNFLKPGPILESLITMSNDFLQTTTIEITYSQL